MIICGQEFSVQAVEYIRSRIASAPSIQHRELARATCEYLNWLDIKGKLKVESCRKALRILDRKNHIELPKPSKSIIVSETSSSSPQKISLNTPLKPVSCKLSDLGIIKTMRIGDYRSSKAQIWNQLVDNYHYLGKGHVCGGQLRYLVHSSVYGWIGAFAFSSASYKLKPRDKWIGWDETCRKANLGKVLCNSRFLIVPTFQVKNLASYLLGQIVTTVKQDWDERYGTTPALLESFVSPCFSGTSYKAANWTYIGRSSGRGRNDTLNSTDSAIKDIYVYELSPSSRQQLCQAPQKKILYSSSLVAPQNWAEEEFGGCYFEGDTRLQKRVLTIACDFYAHPQSNIPQACENRTKTRGAYRFFSNPVTTMNSILTSHYKSTENRISREDVVLAVQDTTSLNYSTHYATTNLGPIGSEKDSYCGLIVHDTMAFTPTGVPLGLIDVQCWARDSKLFGLSQKRKRLPIEQRESKKWLASYTKTCEMQKACPNTAIISVGDREADIYELFDLALKEQSNPGLLVRVLHNRAVCCEGSADNEIKRRIRDIVSQLSDSQEIKIEIPRRGKIRSREAICQLRFSELTLEAPYRKKHLCPLTVWIVNVQEKDAAPKHKLLEWTLLTTVKVTNFKDAFEKVQWYCRRWGIEIYHKTVKSGCRIEERQLGDRKNIESCLAIDMVVAWRVFHLTHLGRETPDAPCSVYFEESQWQALVVFKNKGAVPCTKIPTLREAMLMVASLGGFLGRKCDKNPGVKSIWLGLQRLDDITRTYLVCIDLAKKGKLLDGEYG